MFWLPNFIALVKWTELEIYSEIARKSSEEQNLIPAYKSDYDEVVLELNFVYVCKCYWSETIMQYTYGVKAMCFDL